MFGKGVQDGLYGSLLSGELDERLAFYYLGIRKIPCKMKSPLRQDRHPSFCFSKDNNGKIRWMDFGTGERGRVVDLLMRLWCMDWRQASDRISKDLPYMDGTCTSVISYSPRVMASLASAKGMRKCNVQVKVRPWEPRDIEYWEKYGISLPWLKFGEVYPISHKIITVGSHSETFGADPLAYAYVERKDGKVSIKVYQPYNKEGYKWSGDIDRSVWNLWSQLPKEGDRLIITSSRKDALCLWENTGIPSTAMQGEGYLPKPQVVAELKRRFKEIIVFYDNDFSNPENPGHNDGRRIARIFGAKQIEVPAEYKAKDPSDFCKRFGRERLREFVRGSLGGFSEDEAALTGRRYEIREQ